MKYFCLILIMSLNLFAKIPPINQGASKVLKIWPDGPPDNWKNSKDEAATYNGGVIRISNVSVPTLAVYPVEDKNAPAMIICPGGGYRILAYNKEGEDVCKWLNTLGINAFLLKYRLPVKGDVRHVPPLQDAQRAVSMVRSMAKEYSINTDAIGILGFSAGGHLSAATATAQKRAYKAADDIDKESFKVNFACLIYPAYLARSKGTLNEMFVINKDTPKTFIGTAIDDKGHYKNSPIYADALKKAGVSYLFKSYKTGGHGAGMTKRGTDFDNWTKDCGEWLKQFK